ADRRRVVEQVEADERGDLVVAAAPRAKLAPELRTRDGDQVAFERTVHVFVGLFGGDTAVVDRCGESDECVEHPLLLVTGEVARRRQRRRVRAGTGDVVGGELPVEVGRLAQAGQLRRRTTGEACAPEGADVGGAGG